MNEREPRYATIGDYLRVMRRRRLLIAVIIGICAIGALALSLTQDKEYATGTKIAFGDPLEDLVLIGQGSQVFPTLAPVQRSSIEADRIQSLEVLRPAYRKLDTTVPLSSIASAISTEVDPRTNLVLTTVTWGDPEFAAELANAVTDAAQAGGLDTAKERLRDAEEALTEALKDARRERPLPGIKISVLEGNLERLQGLLTITNPVEIVQRAAVPGAPSSPRPVRNTILGALLGAVLAIVAAFVRDALDRRLHNAHEIFEELHLPIVGRVGEVAFNYAGLAKNGRPVIREADFEAFRVLRMNLAYLGSNGQLRTVLVTSPMPSEGKSTVSVSLASAAALAGSSVLLVECDLRRPSLAGRLNIKSEPGLTDYLQGDAEPQDLLQVVELTPPAGTTQTAPQQTKDDKDATRSVKTKAVSAPSMVVIAAGSRVTNSPELLQSKRFESFLDKVSRAYDLVILDGSPLLSVADPLELAADADGVLLCVRAQQTTRDQARASVAALGHLPPRPSGVVVTGLKRGDETYQYYYGY